MTEGFSKEFSEAMERVRAKRSETGPFAPDPLAGGPSTKPSIEPGHVLLRRFGLMERDRPNTNFAVYNFLGWVHTRGQRHG